MNRLFSPLASADLLNTLHVAATPTTYQPEKHRLAILDASGKEIAFFRLPLTLAYHGTGQAPEPMALRYVLLLIQAGNCALGYFENGVNLDHKVFRSYMVRKKQGKSQVKYLKTKGKSRAGSRVRLGETVEFFENINERLQAYFDRFPIDRIAISCSKTLLPYLYGSKVETPFTKSDPRLLKVPRHTHTPIYEVLLDTNKYLLKGELVYEEAQQPAIEALLSHLPTIDATAADDLSEDW